MLGMLVEPLGNKIVGLLKINTENFGYHLWQMIRTTGFVLIGMLIFRTDSLQTAYQMFVSMITVKNMEMIFNGKLYNIGFTTPDFIVLMIGITMLFTVGLLQERGDHIREKVSKQNMIFRWGLCYIIIFAVILLGIYGPGYNISDFIYGQF